MTALAGKLRAAAAEAQAARRLKRCTTCSLPKDVLAELRAQRARGLSFDTLAVALRSVGVELTGAAVQRHWREHER